MDYIYDIVLNFQNNYYDFFEWKPTDKVINIKKIPVFITNDENYLNLKNNIVTIDKELLPKNLKMFLITNGQEVMGILLDNNGNIIKRSSLLFDESDEVLEEKETIKAFPLKYIKNIKRNNQVLSRVNIEKKKYIERYFRKKDINKDEYLLKYIYYEIYQKEENNIKIVYNTLKELINEDIDKIYNSVKKVNIELKK